MIRFHFFIFPLESLHSFILSFSSSGLGFLVRWGRICFHLVPTSDIFDNSFFWNLHGILINVFGHRYYLYLILGVEVPLQTFDT